MNLEQFTHDEDHVARRYEYDDCSVLAVDFGADRESAAVDVVDDTAIVVVDGTQYELELPTGVDDAHTFIKNGVLTVELEGDL